MTVKTNKTSNYQRNRDYFLGYYYQKKKTRKYNFCTICGTENNKRYNKVCSTACSQSLRKNTVRDCVQKFTEKKRH